MNKKKESENLFKIEREFNNKSTPQEVLRQIIRMKSRETEMEVKESK